MLKKKHFNEINTFKMSIVTTLCIYKQTKLSPLSNCTLNCSKNIIMLKINILLFKLKTSKTSVSHKTIELLTSKNNFYRMMLHFKKQ